jgi:hypothetical protein
MTIQENTLVVLRTNTLQIYTLPSVADDSVVLSKEVQIPTVWEVAVCKTASQSSPDTSLRLIFLSPVGIEMCVIDLDMLAQLDDQPICVRFVITESPRYAAHQDPWYQLCAGETGRRNLWLSTPREGFRDGPHLMYATAPPLLSESAGTVITWDNGGPDRPTPGALPVLDIDEALGLTVIGNCFGELAIYDHVGRYPQKCSGLAHDFTDQESPDSSLMPTVSVNLHPIKLR